MVTSHYGNALQQISSLMTANFVTLNSCKTEFLLDEVNLNFLKYTCSLNTIHHAAGNFSFIFY